MLSWGDFTGDVKFFTVDVELFEYLGNFELVFVYAGGVDVFITNLKSILKALKAFIAFQFVCAITQKGDGVSAIKFDN